MRRGMAQINAPVLVERLEFIHDFYDKIVEKNPSSSAEDIVNFIKLFPEVCKETWDDFKDNWKNNLLLTVYPYYLKADLSPLQNELDNLDEFLAGKYNKEDGEWDKKEASKRKELTDILLKQVSFDLSKITIKG
ncbi:MAG: hypothetical protein CMO44_13330 [Verrucomicrobiales bacterium]|nr:hypothetical protein [Verrucomicrobiales bacterium]|tara:strand:+ start:14302 stop:14703 length:402 start_codon:yes stop_codon:yes gene_type:complete